mmetsp:Transcript_28279/g.84387  ORF Transcript_28279/g.84387 Transcript_28279/m.84387 type:complete len:476 (-) Transcript_28279:214-1641(-)
MSRLARTGRLALQGPARARQIWGAAPQTEPDLTIPMELTCSTPVFESPTATKVTTLSNGLRVASADMTMPSTSLGLFIDTGSQYDAVPGTSHMLQHMAFKTSENFSHLKVVRAAELMGAQLSAVAGRESMVYQVDTLKESVPEAVELLADTVLRPKFLPWEVEEEKVAVKLELDDMGNNPQMLLQELSHTAAYGAQSPLGTPLAGGRFLPHLSPEVLGKFVAEQYVPCRMVLSAAGYEHEELVSLAEASFGHLPSGTPQTSLPFSYVGGEVRESAQPADEMTHFSLAFHGCGWKADELVPLCVLNTMMGGGTSFSAGGPGKGMYTRLFTNILNQHAFVTAASVFNSFYNDTGIFGIYGATTPEAMGQLVAVICDQANKMGSDISAEELGRAKNQLKSSLLMNLESRPILLEDIGRQLLTYGAHTPPLELVDRIDKVTAADLANVTKKITSSPPSVAVYGDTTSVPRYDLIAKQFN